MNSNYYCNLILQKGGAQEQVEQYQQLHDMYTKAKFEEEGKRLDQIAGQIRNELQAKGDVHLLNEVCTCYTFLFSTLLQFEMVEVKSLTLQLLLGLVTKMNAVGNMEIQLEENGIFNFVKLQVSLVEENQFNEALHIAAMNTVDNHIN